MSGKKSNEKFYQTQDWDTIYSRIPPNISHYLAQEAEFFRQNVKPGRVLDVGCGTGRTLSDLEGAIDQGFGIDIVEASIEKCIAKLPSFDFSVRSISDTNFEDSYFDTIIMSYNIIGNLNDEKEKSLKEANRILKGGGVVLFSVYSEKARRVQEEKYESFGFQDVRSDATSTSFRINGSHFTSERFSRRDLERLFDPYKLTLVENDFSYFGKAVKT